MVAAPLLKVQKLSERTERSVPLVKTGEAGLEGAAGGDSITDTRGSDNARAGKHLTEAGASVVREFALEIVLGVKARVGVDTVDNPIILGGRDSGGSLGSLGGVDFDTGHDDCL